MQNCIYKTIEAESEGLYKEKGSKFIAYAYPVLQESSVKMHVEKLKKEHHSARHHCWAYRLGADGTVYRVFDDGEPSHSAGNPILGQIDAFSLTNVAIVVVRYFGGTLLGVGGLMQAYKEAAKNALVNAIIIEKTVEVFYKLIFPYELNNVVITIIKQRQGTVVSQSYENECEIVCAIPKSQEIFFMNQFELQTNIIITSIHE